MTAEKGRQRGLKDAQENEAEEREASLKTERKKDRPEYFIYVGKRNIHRNLYATHSNPEARKESAMQMIKSVAMPSH